jgi:hypothetical protein
MSLKPNKNKKDIVPWYHRPLWTVVIGVVITFLLAIITYYLTQWKDTNINNARNLKEKAPIVSISDATYDPEFSTAEFSVVSSWWVAYTEWSGNTVLTRFVAKDSEGKKLDIQEQPKEITDKPTTVKVDTSEAKWTITLTQECEDTTEKIPCYPKGINTQKVLSLPNYKWLKILWIDATFKDDNIDFSMIKKFFTEQWAIFYWTQSPWRNPWEGVLRIDKKLFFWKKILFVFYNDKKNIDDATKNWVKKALQWSFTHLDEVRFYSFTDIRDALSLLREDSDIRFIFWFIWDCNLKSHGGCSNKLFSSWKYPLFTQNMITEEIDFLFIVPATKDTKVTKWDL